jgi:drug/metabolite transporter (DMT)-like permease
MIPALATVLLFAGSAIASERATIHLGSLATNTLRLLLAAAILWTATLLWFAESLRLPIFALFLVSGMVGFGLGDTAMFCSYHRIGARLTVLLNLCTAPLWSTALERLWLGTVLSTKSLVAIGLVVAGVALALWSRDPQAFSADRRRRLHGILFGLAAGAAMGVGTVISKKAFILAQLHAVPVHGLSAAAQRVAGGVLVAILLWTVFQTLLRRNDSTPPDWRSGSPWLLTSTILGPVLGVSAFQLALAELPSGIVTAIAATTPIAVIPLHWISRREVPTPLALSGSLLAVSGVVVLIA